MTTNLTLSPIAEAIVRHLDPAHCWPQESENIISLSGGKDSTALLLLAVAMEVPNLQAVFADTGHESPITYEYVAYLEAWMAERGIPLRRVRADFTDKMAGKRKFIAEKWPGMGVPPERVARALQLLHPTGNPFLDLCLWKGRFPSTKGRFCTDELKVYPMTEQVIMPAMDRSPLVFSWQGVRADESENRRWLPECSAMGGGLFHYRPILRWTVADVFEAHRFMGVKHNPLYTQGMGRVGCMPCIMVRKDELREIALRFPEEIERVHEMELLAQQTSKSGKATFFEADTVPGNSRELADINQDTHGIWAVVEWTKTSRGGKQYDLLDSLRDASGCSSIHGLCE